MTAAEEAIGQLQTAVGPRGGDLNAAWSRPEWRNAEFDGDVTKLHRFEKDHDSATNGRKNEQPWYRMAAYMLLAGRTNSEIALAAGTSAVTVSHLRQQKWFQQLLATIANEEGAEVTGALKSYALEAVEGIADIARTSESDRVKLTAYTTLLEHSNGKPLQKVISATSHSTHRDPKEEMSELKKELDTLTKQ